MLSLTTTVDSRRGRASSQAVRRMCRKPRVGPVDQQAASRPVCTSDSARHGVEESIRVLQERGHATTESKI